MNNLFKISTRWFLPFTITSFLQLATAQTVTYTNAGVFTTAAPAGVHKATFKLWGAGGGGSLYPTQFPIIARGGGGAFSSVTLDVQPGDVFVIVVGQGGATNDASLGGAGSGNTEGGAPGVFEGSTGRSQGGQASSVFLLANDLYLVKAIAGGGGGAGIGANGGGAGEPGQSQPPATGGLPGMNATGGGGLGGFGGNYNSNAVTTGISALSLAGGNGGSSVVYSGGGGGGYGGGGGGASDPMTSGSGGGGGGSYGTIVTNGAGIFPANTSDPNYIGSAGNGGSPNASGSDGLIVVIWISASNTPAPTLVNPMRLGDGSFQFSFTNATGTTFSALATTNVADSNSWSLLGTAMEVSAGQFQFTDTQATNYPQRFYRLRSE